MEKEESGKLLLIVVIIFAVVAAVLISILVYSKYHSELASDTALSTPTAVAHVTATPTSALTPTATPCSVGLTAIETGEVSGWLTYTNATRHYSFKYPSGWTVSDADKDNVTVRGTDSGAVVSFQVRAGTKTEIGFAEFSVTGTTSRTIDCLSATESSYNGEGDSRMINNTFTHSATPFLFIYSYHDLGASYSGDMIDQQNLVVKTFSFS